MKMKKVLFKLLGLSMIVSGIFFSNTKISAISDPILAPEDWAFDVSSVNLHDVILSKYPNIDTNGDGYISISEAQEYNGDISINRFGNSIGGTLNGIENFINAYGITVADAGIIGEIPDNIGQLKNLKHLYLRGNELTGTIPVSIGELIKIEMLDLSNNHLNGELPSSIGNLENLQFLDIGGNQISGEIPDEYQYLEGLRVFKVGNNQITGGIPGWFDELNSLHYIDLSNNLLSGEIPQNIMNISNLAVFDVRGNQFTSINPDTFYYLCVKSSTVITPNLSNQKYTVNLTSIGQIGNDYTFTGFPIYEQFPQLAVKLPLYEMTMKYKLNLPSGEMVEIDPIIENGEVTILGNELMQKGNYTMIAEGTTKGVMFTDYLYETHFVISDEKIDYISVTANGHEHTETSTSLIIELSKVPNSGDLTLDDITLNSNDTINIDGITPLGSGRYELIISGSWNEGSIISVELSKNDIEFAPNSHTTVLHRMSDNKTEGIDIEGGESENRPNIKSLPNTGVSTNMLSLFAMFSGASIIVVSCLVRRKEEL